MMRASIVQEQPLAAYAELDGELDASSSERFDADQELGAGNVFRHPTLGYVRSVPRADLADAEQLGGDQELGPGGVARHPTFGYVRSVPRAAIAAEALELEEEVIGADQRVPVLDTTAAPYRWICHLALDFGPNPAAPAENIIARGSGTLISDRHVLTAGHNLFDRDLGQVQRVRVTPGHNCAATRAAPLGFAMASATRAHPQWRSSFDRQLDFGLITLQSAIGRQPQAALGNRPLGFWGSADRGEGTRINPRAPAALQRKRAYISGYPGDKCCFNEYDASRDCRPNSWAGAQFRATGHVTNASPASAPRLILYDLDTFGGHSGSPVWVRWGNYRNLVAIHTGPGSVVPGEPAHVSNRGVRITADVMTQVRTWMRS